MIKTLEKSKYLASSLQISYLRDKLKISKNEMSDELKSVNIKGFSPRTYLRLENQESEFELSKFEELAKGFIKIAKKKKIDIGKVFSTNLISKNSPEKNKNSVSKLLPITSSGNLIKLIHATTKKKIFGLENINPNSRESVKNILDLIPKLNSTPYRVTSDEDPANFDIEKEILEISSSLNLSLNYLVETYGVRLFAGILELPILDISWVPRSKWDKGNKDKDNEMYEICPRLIKYLIYNFSDDSGADYYDLTYENQTSFKEMKDFIKNNPYHETYPIIDPYDKVKESLLFNYEFSSTISNKIYLPKGMVYDHTILEPKLNFEDYDEIPF